MSSKKNKEKRSISSWAFRNQYNLIMLGGAGLFALATFSWLPLLIGAGAEVLWLTIGADTSFFRRWVERQEGLEADNHFKQELAAMLSGLNPDYIERFKGLEVLAQKIQNLAKENPSLETQLLQSEMDKLGKMMHSFLSISTLHQRLSNYLRETHEEEILRDITSCEAAIQRERSPDVLEGLEQNLGLAQKRLRQHQKVMATHRLLSIKADTIEKSFRFLQTQILGISKHEDLSKELNDMLSGLGAVDEIVVETDGLLSSRPVETEQEEFEEVGVSASSSRGTSSNNRRRTHR
jgi:hypothetical protein